MSSSVIQINETLALGYILPVFPPPLTLYLLETIQLYSGNIDSEKTLISSIFSTFPDCLLMQKVEGVGEILSNILFFYHFLRLRGLNIL